MNTALGISGFIVFTLYGIAQIVAGINGIEYYYGAFWAWAAIFASIMFRFTLPITIGSFLGAMKVWGWHWFFAALFAAPSLIFIIPGTLAFMFTLIRRK